MLGHTFFLYVCYAVVLRGGGVLCAGGVPVVLLTFFRWGCVLVPVLAFFAVGWVLVYFVLPFVICIVYVSSLLASLLSISMTIKNGI